MQTHEKTRELTKQLTPSKKRTTREEVSRQRSQTDNSGQGKLLKSQKTRPTQHTDASKTNRRSPNPSAKTKYESQRKNKKNRVAPQRNETNIARIRLLSMIDRISIYIFIFRNR